MKNQAETEALMMRLRQREAELMQVQQLTQLLAAVESREMFGQVLRKMAPDLGFHAFAVAVAAENAKEYQLFYQMGCDSAKVAKTAAFNVADGYFDMAVNAPEPVVFPLPIAIKTTQLLLLLAEQAKPKARSMMGIPLQAANGQAVAFLFFTAYEGPSREAQRLLRMLASQLSITVKNLQFSEKAIQNVPVAASAGTLEATQTAPLPKHGIIGESPAIEKVRELVMQVAKDVQIGVLITGESGTGKELVAEAIHQASSRSKNRLVKINCAAIPAALLESELFGHEKGSFTGAYERKKGKFELAHNSTILLDEIGEMPLELQAKLLRVIQEKEIEPIGAAKPMRINTRIIAATNRNLSTEVAVGRFRADLYYRLNIVEIHVPPLRDRIEDLPALSRYFLEGSALAKEKKITGFSAKVSEAMALYSWPGNIRELQNAISRAIVLNGSGHIGKLPLGFNRVTQAIAPELTVRTLEEVERAYILEILKKCNGRISGPNGAAKLLGLPSTSLNYKIQKLGIRKEHFSI